MYMFFLKIIKQSNWMQNMLHRSGQDWTCMFKILLFKSICNTSVFCISAEHKDVIKYIKILCILSLKSKD